MLKVCSFVENDVMMAGCADGHIFLKKTWAMKEDMRPQPRKSKITPGKNSDHL